MTTGSLTRRSRDSDSRALALRDSGLRRLGVSLVCVTVASIPLIFDHSADWPFTVPKALLTHALAYVLAGVMTGLFIRFGSTFLVRSWLHFPVAAFVLASAVSAAFAQDSTLALYGTHARMLGLGTLVAWAALYFAVVLLVRTRVEAIAVVVSALAAAVLVLAYELMQLLGKDPFQWALDPVHRPFSTIGQPTSLAQYLTILAIGTSGLALLLRGLAWPVRVLLVAYAGVMLAGAAATLTRSALLGVVAGSVVLVVSLWFIRATAYGRLISVIGVGLTTAALVAMLTLSPLGARLAATVQVPSGTDVEDILAYVEPSTAVRLSLYLIAAEMVRERPILGYGPDNFIVGIPKYRSAGLAFELRQSLPTSAHGWVSQFASTGGLVGLGAFVAIAGCALLVTIRSGFQPLAAIGCAMLAAFLATGLTTINEVSTDWLFWISAGTVAGATASSGAVANGASPQTARAARARSRRGPQRDAFQLRSIAAVACVLAASGLALASLGAMEASRSNRSAQLARLEGASARAIEFASRATTSDPGRAEYWRGLGLAYLSASRLRDASNALERAIRLAPHDVRYVGDLARVQILLIDSGDTSARGRAVDLAERAVATDPNNPGANLTRALVMYAVGDLPEALRSIQRALELDPQSPNTSVYLAGAQLNIAAGRPTEAMRIARDGITYASSPITTVALRLELARALAANDELAAALIEVDAALKIQPNHSTALNLRNDILARLQR